MSTRTPGLQTRSQYHSYWGQYFYNVGAGVWVNGSNLLPGAPGNPLSASEFAKIEVGDTASTTDAGIPNRGLFVCVDKPTAATVEWRRLDAGAAVVQTVRAAPVITVGQQPGIVIPGAPPPYNLGDGAGIEADYIDIGDAAQLNAALLAAAASNVPIDIRLRPCGLNLGQATSPVSPLFLPDGCRLQGAGVDISSIFSDSRPGNTQETLVMGKGSSLLDIQIKSDDQPAAVAGASPAVVATAGAGTRVKDCRISLNGVARAQPWAFWDASAGGEVLDSKFDAQDQTNVNAAGPSICVVEGPNPITSPDTYIPIGEFRINGCSFAEANQAISIYNTGGGHISECDMDTMQRSQFGVISIYFAGTVAQPAPTFAATICDVRMTIGIAEAIDDTTYTGVKIENAMDGLNVGAFEWTAIRVAFFPTPVAPNVVRNAFRVFARGVTTGDCAIEGGSIVACYALGHTRGIFVDAVGVAAQPPCRVTDLRIDACTMKNPTTVGATVGKGIFLQSVAPASVDAIGITNCNCKGAVAGQFGIDIFDAGCVNTIAVANSLSPSGGTALNDAGIGTEAGHNILV